MYTDIDFKTGKEVREAVKSGREITVYQHNAIFPVSMNGVVSIGGPHYPKPHKWYLRAEISNGIIVKVLK